MCPRAKGDWSRSGITLAELVIAMAIISIGLVGALMVSHSTTRHSADPMIQKQALAVAEAYLEEILLQAYLDPDTVNVCPAAEGRRANYHNV